MCVFSLQQGMISEAAYNLQWHDASIQTKKCLILILARSNKFTTLNGGKMYYLRLESFVMVRFETGIRFD